MYPYSPHLLIQGIRIQREGNRANLRCKSCILIFTMYWNLFEILPYQRHFNLINGPREIGKTYTTLMWLIKQALQNNRQFVYICRTQDEKKNGILSHATKKVLAEQFPDYEAGGSNFILTLNDIPVAHCVSLSEYMKIKKYSFPNTRYILFDEYMLEPQDSSAYIKGWKEPDLFLSVYQTIDRGRDSTICFLLGNNTAFYNPYHLHPAFDIPFVNPGNIWTSKNVLFQWAVPSDELKQKLARNAIIQQIQGTEYGRYALEGQYIGENQMFLGNLDDSCYYQFTIRFKSFSFGVYTSAKFGYALISNKIDPNCKFDYALTLDDHSENTLLLSRDNVHLKWLGYLYKRGLVKFTSMKIKQQCADVIRMVVK